MKEEGLLNKALQKVIDGTQEARWLLNQAGFNFEDNTPATSTQKACISFAIVVLSKDGSVRNAEHLISRALVAESIGELKAIVNEIH
ncbi:hypothetical protein [Rheinheimera sp.]|uniref:hypothetical protein n=1 Tax=Rheinheimera sp. TaxID=1869214 RepID=UPI002623D3BD|nr:hypothetical protein [Rheinheimera sp.]MCA1931655.1 hypothetical protein [Rheinheimera sp.]